MGVNNINQYVLPKGSSITSFILRTTYFHCFDKSLTTSLTSILFMPFERFKTEAKTILHYFYFK